MNTLNEQIANIYDIAQKQVFTLYFNEVLKILKEHKNLVKYVSHQLSYPHFVTYGGLKIELDELRYLKHLNAMTTQWDSVFRMSDVCCVVVKDSKLNDIF